MKANLNYYQIDDDQIIDFIQRNKKRFESLLKIFFRLEKLGHNPNDYIINQGRIASVQNLNNQLVILETLALYNKPKNKADRAKRGTY